LEKFSKHHKFLFPIFIFVAMLSLYACRSSRLEPTKGFIYLEPSATVFSRISDPTRPLPPTSSPEAISEAPVITSIDAQEPASTIIPPNNLPEPTKTPVPPLVITPKIPQYPMTGIEISNISNIEQAAQAGAYWIRRNALIWSVIEPAEGAREWGAMASLEQELISISAHGMHTILIVRGTPSWAQKNMGEHCGPIIEDKLTAFASFLHDAVARYSQPPYNVKYWEIWNEPDVDPRLVAPDSPFGCWGDPADTFYGGGYYAEMLKAVYPAIKSADPEAQVLVGGLLLLCDPENPPDVNGQPGVKVDCSPAKFLEGILKNGGGNYFDGVSFHAYDYYYDRLGKYGNGGWRSSWDTTGPVLIAKATYLQNLLKQYGYTDKYLMNTELAVLCGSSGNEPSCQQTDWDNTKAYHLVEAYTAAATEELRANVWFSIVGWRGSGLLDVYGQPVSAYRALSFNVKMLTSAVPWGEVTLYQGVMGFAFQRDGKLIWILWSRDGQDHTIPLGALPSAIYNVVGESIPPDTNITITLSPIYIEW
jgi:hypothetical protein